VATHFKRPEVVQGSSRCGLISTMPVILPNGDVSTCWDHPDYIVGNIRHDPFMEIWNGSRYRRFRELLGRGLLPTCSRCTGLYE
jgi:radical SAM protein with 4Fe4S-binding SPASM domain